MRVFPAALTPDHISFALTPDHRKTITKSRGQGSSIDTQASWAVDRTNDVRTGANQERPTGATTLGALWPAVRYVQLVGS